MSDRVGVLGASGYVGTATVRSLREAGYDVRPAAGSTHDSYPTVDVRDPDAVRSFVADLDAVVNTAGLVGIDACEDDPELAFEVNAMGAATVAWTCRRQSVPLVNLSSVAAIGDPGERPITADSPRTPTTTYGRTKLLGERAAETLAADRVPVISFYVTNVYGSPDGAAGGHSVLDFFVDRGAAGDPLTVYRPGTQERDFVHVRDVADAIVAAVDSVEESSPGYRSFVLGSGQSYSVLELAGLVASAVAAADGDTPAIELREPPSREGPRIERFSIDPSTVESALAWAPEWHVREWIATAVDRRLAR